MMTEIEKIQRYIKRTGFENRNYVIRFGEAKELANCAAESPVSAIWLAFDYGRAKGYRAGSKGIKKISDFPCR